jgi:hypothetical protein
VTDPLGPLFGAAGPGATATAITIVRVVGVHRPAEPTAQAGYSSLFLR